MTDHVLAWQARALQRDAPAKTHSQRYLHQISRLHGLQNNGQLAGHLGVHRMQVQRWMESDGEIGPAAWEKISAELGLDPGEVAAALRDDRAARRARNSRVACRERTV